MDQKYPSTFDQNANNHFKPEHLQSGYNAFATQPFNNQPFNQNGFVFGQTSATAGVPNWNTLFKANTSASLPITNQQPLNIPTVNPVVKPPATYHLSFINQNHGLIITLMNSVSKTRVMTHIVGKGVKFDLNIPIDENIDISVVSLEPVIENKPELKRGLIALVDDDPFLMRKPQA